MWVSAERMSASGHRYDREQMITIEQSREFYAQELRFAANLTTPGLVEAFARVPREKFLGPPPWQLGSANQCAMSAAGLGQLNYVTVTDPRDLYHNVVVSIDRAKDINNGQPSSLALWIEAMSLKPGDRVYHLGCGVGYYSAIMAEVVGPLGHVTGLELQSDLAERAKENLTGYPNVEVHAGDGATFDPGECDAMLVNCGVTHPQAIWLNRLKDAGCLILPVTVAMNATIGQGLMFKFVRQGEAFSAVIVSPVAIFSGTNLRDREFEPLMAKAFSSGGLLRLKSIRLDTHMVTDSCVLHGRDVCLSTAPSSAQEATAC